MVIFILISSICENGLLDFNVVGILHFVRDTDQMQKAIGEFDMIHNAALFWQGGLPMR